MISLSKWLTFQKFKNHNIDKKHMIKAETEQVNIMVLALKKRCKKGKRTKLFLCILLNRVSESGSLETKFSTSWKLRVKLLSLKR